MTSDRRAPFRSNAFLAPKLASSGANFGRQLTMQMLLLLLLASQSLNFFSTSQHERQTLARPRTINDFLYLGAQVSLLRPNYLVIASH